jgi:hypothetical protein
VPYMSPIEQEETARGSAKIEAEFQDLEARSRALREQIDEHEMHEAEAMSMGTEPGPRTRQYARPHCPKRPGLPWLLILGYLAILFLGLVEVFQLTFPILDRWGIDTSSLALEWQRAPLTVIGGVATAITATACLIFAWHILVNWAVALSTEWESAGPLRSGAKLLRLTVFSLMLFFFTLCITNLRHDNAASASGFQGAAIGQTASSTDTGLFFFMSFLMPAGAAYIQFQISKSPYWQARADFHKQQALYEQAKNQLSLPPAKRADILEILREKLAQCDKEQAGLEARRRALSARVDAYRNEYHKRLDDERSAVEIYTRTLVSQLETECYYFVRHANRCKAMHLVSREPVCLSPESASDSPTEGDGAPSHNGKAPRYRVARPLLTDGHWQEI